MAGFTFSAEEVRSAPPAVRQWMEGVIAATLLAAARTQQEPRSHSEELAACTAEEAVQIFQMIQQDLAATLVFLELAHEPIGTTSPSLNAFDIGDIIRRTRLTPPLVAQAFMTINQIFQQLRNDPQATLFGFDQANHVYVHATTHRSIRSLWAGLVQMAAPPMVAARSPTESPPGIAPLMRAATPATESPHGVAQPPLGPSQDIAAHDQS